MKILVVITQAETAFACLDAAVAAGAALPGATIEVLPTIVSAEDIIAAAPIEQFAPRSDPRDSSAGRRAAACQDAFLAWRRTFAGDSPRVEWKNLGDHEDLSVRGEAEDASLVVMARGENMDAGDGVHVALFEARTPLLIVPGEWRPRDAHGFRHVAVGVAYDASESAAVTAAQPWLRAAGRVTAIRIEEQLVTAPPDGEELGKNLRVEWHVVTRRSDLELGSQIAKEASALGADLLVCGAYGHNSLVEWLRGSTTRDLLGASDVALLLAH
ncbi:universal stress protein [Sphingomonas oryzagri]